MISKKLYDLKYFFGFLKQFFGFRKYFGIVPYRLPYLIDMHNGRVNDVTYCYNLGFLHTNEVSSSILISVALV